MFVYEPKNMISERIKQAEIILNKINVKHAFISGSFLFKKDYEDIDLFIITRKNKEKFKKIEPKLSLHILDFNDLHSIFFHSVSKSCVSKNILPKKDLKLTITNYWNIINETIPELLNNKENFKKIIRSYVVASTYLKNKFLMNSFQLNKKISSYKDYYFVINEIFSITPDIIRKNAKKTYIKRLFYTYRGFYKEDLSYDSLKLLYELSKIITQGVLVGGQRRVQETDLRTIIPTI